MLLAFLLGVRLYTSPALHVGVRPAVFNDGVESAVGLTVQVSTKWF